MRKIKIFDVEDDVHLAVIHYVMAFLESRPWNCECRACENSRNLHFSVFTPRCITDRTKLVAMMILMDEKTYLTPEDIVFMPDEEARDRYERLFIRWKHEQDLITTKKIGHREKGVKLSQCRLECGQGRKRRVIRKSEPMAG